MQIRFTRYLLGTIAMLLLALGLSVACDTTALAQVASSTQGYYTYTLSGVTFDENGTGVASGYFDYDPTTGQFGSFDIVTTQGTFNNNAAALGNTYTNTDSSINYYGASSTGGDFIAAFDLGDDYYFNIMTAQPLTGSGTFDLSDTEEGLAQTSTFRNGNSGTISGAPEISAVPELSPAFAIAILTVLGAGALLAASRSRKSTARALDNSRSN